MNMKNLCLNFVPTVLLASFPFSCLAASGAVHTVPNHTIADFHLFQNTDIRISHNGEVLASADRTIGLGLDPFAVSLREQTLGNAVNSLVGDVALTGLTPLLASPALGEGKIGVFPTQGEDNKLNVFKTAAVCFITDTENCGGYKFDGGTTPGEECERAGYVDGVCPEGSHAESTCPGDSSYHTPCVCNSDMTATCTYPYQGVGAQCNGKYKECCNTCPDYPETSIGANYVSAGECESCDGKKYKVKCNPNTFVDSVACGSLGGTGGTCTDSNGTHYKQCKCPLNYEWSASQRKCVCASSFKYSCTGTGYLKGKGDVCDNKYSECECATTYKWDAAKGACVCSGTDFCAIPQDCKALGYSNSISCSGDILRCPFDTGYVFCL